MTTTVLSAAMMAGLFFGGRGKQEPPPPKGSERPAAATLAEVEKPVSYDLTVSPFGLHVIEGDTAGARALGARWSRVMVLWKWVEPRPGEFHMPEKAVQSLAALSAAGLEPLPRIEAINPWAAEDHINALNEEAARKKAPMGNWTYLGYPKDPEAYRAFVTRVVESFDLDGVDDAPGLKSKVTYWQIENEWDWRWKDSPEKMVEFLKLAYETIKKADPSAKVVLGGISKLSPDIAYNGYLGEKIPFKGKIMSPADVGREKHFKEDYPKRRYVLEHGHKYFDVISFHQYGRRQVIPLEMDYLHDIMRKQGYSKPVWMTEAGGPFTSAGEKYTEDIQAQEVVKYYVTAMASGVSVVFWSTYLPTPEWGMSFENTSLLDRSKRQKPACHTYALMTKQLGSATRVDRLLHTGGVFAAKFTRPDRPAVYVMWADGTGDRATPALQRLRKELGPRLQGKTLRVTDYKGQTETVTAGEGGFGKLLSAGPVFVEVE